LEKLIAAIAEKLAGVAGLPVAELRGMIEIPPDAKMGDLALPCFRLAGRLGGKPPEVAARLAGALGAGAGGALPVSATAAGPYLNIAIDRAALAEAVIGEARSSESGLPPARPGAGRTAVIEFSSPNIAKPFTVALLRGTALGAALARLHEALGWRVVRCNYFGDWGTQFGKVIAAWRRWGAPAELEADPIKHLLELYVRFDEEARADEALVAEARAIFKRLEEGGAGELELWERFRRLSLDQFERIYAQLGIGYDSCEGEAHYRDRVAAAVEFLRSKGLVSESQGATVVDLEKHKLGVMLLLKSDDASIYASRDVAAALDRHRRWAFDRLVYVVGADQKLHFQQVFKSLELAGCSWAAGCVHVDFGMVLVGGEKMSTRRGRIVLLEDVLRDAAERAGEVIAAKNPQLATAGEVARAVGQAAVLFASLSVRRNKTVDFDWQRIVSFEGETGPYVQYTHARLCSVLRKAGRPVPEAPDWSRLLTEDERGALRQLGRMGQVLQRSAAECEPAQLCTWLLEAASAVNNFYNQQRVLGDDAELTGARLALVDAARRRLRAGLEILGITPLEEM
jgi:arginyl-tRNA synthetase